MEQAEEAARQVVVTAAEMGVATAAEMGGATAVAEVGVATAVAEVGVVDVDVATRSRYVHTSKGGWTKKIRTRLGSSFSYITSHPRGNIKLYI